MALTGASGSGKSTLLHCLGCLETPDAGTTTIDGRNLTDLSEAGKAEAAVPKRQFDHPPVQPHFYGPLFSKVSGTGGRMFRA
ncbi:ATP-binding cassette domain-containing protein [uncultured Roseobacter sp.]|uniref:ATP-binding cassette domain-containing protein n=1 Tax=uncultured Roseobacter sp. TaxID=114847 RepID=UPI002626E95B|nr:ATP-binding cassette domain-containing protein [uncultured Roseobacter sp.]